MEHWLPFFYETARDAVRLPAGRAPVVVDHLAEEALGDRLEQVARPLRGAARRASARARSAGAVPYKPLPPGSALSLARRVAARARRPAGTRASRPSCEPTATRRRDRSSAGAPGRTFAAERAAGDVNVFDALVAHVGQLEKAGRKVVLASWSEGARDRLGQVLATTGCPNLKPVENWRDAAGAAARARSGLAVLAARDRLRDRPTSPSSASRTSSATASSRRAAGASAPPTA